MNAYFWLAIVVVITNVVGGTVAMLVSNCCEGPIGSSDKLNAAEQNMKKGGKPD